MTEIKHGRRDHLRLPLAASILLLWATVASSGASWDEEARASYSGFALYRCTPHSEEQIEALRELQTSQKNGEIEFWKEPMALNSPVDIMVSPEAEDFLRTRLRVSRVQFKKIMHDVGEVIRRTSVVLPSQGGGGHARHGRNLTITRADDPMNPSSFYASFQSYSSIETKLKTLASADPRMTLEEIGRSYERRPIYLARVSADSKSTNQSKPVIFIDAGHHAREWASHSTILYILESLLGNELPRSKSLLLSIDESEISDRAAAAAASVAALNGTFGQLLERFDFWLLPVVNPDGYEYSHKVDRLWRKTRSRNGGCTGVDPNRNYPFKWKQNYDCGEVYSGPKPLSEPETEALANVLLRSNRKIAMYISLHAYAAMILSPYGYDQIYPENYGEMRRVASVGMRAIRTLRGTNYRFGPAAVMLYRAAGGSDDFAYASANIKLSYTIELAERGFNGFLMPPEEIVATGQETALGIAAMVDAVRLQ